MPMDVAAKTAATPPMPPPTVRMPVCRSLMSINPSPVGVPVRRDRPARMPGAASGPTLRMPFLLRDIVGLARNGGLVGGL